VVKQLNDEDFGLDNFEIIKYLLERGGKHEYLFPTIVFLAHYIVGLWDLKLKLNFFS
jgi:hypothetical protein